MRGSDFDVPEYVLRPPPDNVREELDFVGAPIVNLADWIVQDAERNKNAELRSRGLIALINGKGVREIVDDLERRFPRHRRVTDSTVQRDWPKLLRDKGRGLKAKTRFGGTPLHDEAMSAAGSADEIAALLNELLAEGEDLEERDRTSRTPLHLAAAFNTNPAMIRTLRRAGADLEARTATGLTPLHHAALANDNPAVIDALLDAGADARARDGLGQTPWNYAENRKALQGSSAYRRLQAPP